jgi:hypothetical protein
MPAFSWFLDELPQVASSLLGSLFVVNFRNSLSPHQVCDGDVCVTLCVTRLPKNGQIPDDNELPELPA